MTCDRCHAVIEIGTYPFCPHGTVRGGIIDDQLDGGPRWFENLGHERVWIETKTQLRQECAARGLEPRVRAVPGDKYLKPWTTMDAQTLDNARTLVARAAGATVRGAPDIEQAPVIERYSEYRGESSRVRVER